MGVLVKGTEVTELEAMGRYSFKERNTEGQMEVDFAKKDEHSVEYIF